MNHKRKGPKSTRSGCLMCKPWKRQGCDRRTLQEVSRDEIDAIHESEDQAWLDSGAYWLIHGEE